MSTADTTFEAVGDMTVPELFQLRVQESSDALAVHSVQTTLTFREWWKQAMSIAELLGSLFGSLHGERVALWFTNDEAATYVSALQATFELGAIACALDDRYAVPEARRIFAHAEPRTLVLGPQVAERLGLDGLADLGVPDWSLGEPWDVAVLAIEGDACTGAPTGWTVAGCQGAREQPRVAQPSDDALIAFTSGSTGAPKGPIWSQAAICQYAERLSHVTYALPRGGEHLSNADVLQSPIPIYTAAALIENIYPTVFSGCKVVFEGRRFDPAASEERMAQHGTTVYNGVPAFFAMMCDLPAGPPGAAPDMMIMSGSALTAGLYRRMVNRWPTTAVTNWYGLNESGTGQMINFGPDMDRHPESIGRPLPPTEIRVVDASLNPVPPGTEGDLLMRAPGQMRAYWNSPEQTAERFRGDWLFTGDRVVQTDDGLLHVVGRNEDRINRGGFKFYPAEVRSALESHEAVQEAAVIAVPHEVLGQDAVAFVVKSDEALDEDALRQYCRTQIAPNKVPGRVFFLDALPRAAYGKVNRHKLLALADGHDKEKQT